MSEVLVVVSKVKKMVKEQGLRTGEDFITALSEKVDAMVRRSIEKVKAGIVSIEEVLRTTQSEIELE